MCDPVTLAALALTAVGATTSYVGEQKAASARERTFMQERSRQKGFEAEQAQRFQDSVAQATEMATPEAATKAAEDRKASLVAALRPEGGASSYLPGAASAAPIVATANDRAQGEARGRTLDLASAIAALGGTGDQLQRLNIGIGRNSEAIDQAHGFKAGSSGVLQDEMTAASAKGGNLRAIGGLAQQLGSAWMGASMGGVGGRGMPANLLKGTPYDIPMGVI